MSDTGRSGETGANEDTADEGTRSIVPFVVAAVLAALVLGGILLAGLLAPVEKNVTEQDRIAGAAREFADASGRFGLAPPEQAVCPGFEPARSPLAGRIAPGETGKSVEITKFGDVRVTGDSATIEVTSRVGGAEATGTWNLVRVGGDWRVCQAPAR